MPDTATCRSCGAPVEWLLTARGNLIPVDLAPDPAGLYVVDDDRLTYIAHVPPDVSRALERRTSHYATCPNVEANRAAKMGAVDYATVAVLVCLLFLLADHSWLI